MASMIPLGGALRLKSSEELPPHITREQYLEMVETAKKKHDSDGYTRRTYVHLVRGRRDPLLLRMMWETGGRVSDIANLCLNDFDFSRRLLRLRVKKTGRVNEIPLEEGTLLDVSSYMPGHFAEHPKEPLFGINRWPRRRRRSSGRRMPGPVRVRPDRAGCPGPAARRPHRQPETNLKPFTLSLSRVIITPWRVPSG